MNDRSLFRTLVVVLLSGWLGLFILIPNLMVLVASFLERDEVSLLRPVFSPDSYLRLVDPVYLQVFLHSFSMAFLATVLCLLIGYPFAFLLARTRSGLRQALLVLVIIPFWTNSLVRTYAIKTILTVRGLFNGVLQGLGIIDEPLRLLYTGPSVIAGLVYVLLPFMVLPLFASIEKLEPVLLEAAVDLGAGKIQTFRRVIIPLTMPGIVAGCLMVFLPALGMFYVSDLLGGAKDLLIGNFIKNQFLDARDWPFGAAASVTLTLMMAALLLVYGWSRRRLGQKELDA